MTRTTLAAIVMVAIMALSVCTAVNLTTATKAEAAVATKLTASVSPKYPYRGEQFTISGTLTTSDGTPLPNKAITVSWKCLTDGRSGKLASVKTDSQGRYARTDSAKVSPKYRYTVTFSGDRTYARASTSLYISVGMTVTYITSTNYKPLRNQPITLSPHVFLTDGVHEVKIPNTITLGDLTIYRRVSDGQGGWTAWKEYKKVTLGRVHDSGHTTAYGYTLDTQFKAVYPGNAKLFGSESKPITITGFGVD